MNNVIIANIIRLIGLVLLQGLVLRNIGAGWDEFTYLQVILHPLFILLLPLRTPTALILLLAFICGIAVDGFYSSLGIHASASVFIALARPAVLKMLQPHNGYNINDSPTAARWGFAWFIRYAAIMFALYLFWYFSVEAFTFVYLGDILLKTLVSFIVTMIFVVVYQVILNPVD